MLYRTNKKTGDRISALGFGLMRLPVDENNKIDYGKAKEMLDYCMAHGVNYFDTALSLSRRGKGESFLGKALEGKRESVFIATKLFPLSIYEYADMEKMFSSQLKKLRTDYIDYYMLHGLVNFEQWQKLKDLGVIRFIEEKKASGAIRQIGVSAHMTLRNFKRLLDDYPWDFCADTI